MIIGFAGYKGSGKDTAAEVLIKTFGWDKMSFAASVKDVVSSTFKLNRTMLNGTTTLDRELREIKDPDLFNKSPRELLQIIGTNFRNEISKDVWVRIVERAYRNHDNNVVITDVRFPNEIDMISKYGFVVGIKRPGFTGDSHESERALDNTVFKYIINNDSTIEELKSKVNRLVEGKIV